MPEWHPDVTEMLMGTEVPPRRTFIYENATEAETGRIKEFRIEGRKDMSRESQIIRTEYSDVMQKIIY